MLAFHFASYEIFFTLLLGERLLSFLITVAVSFHMAVLFFFLQQGLVDTNQSTQIV